MARRRSFGKKIDTVHWTGVFANALGIASAGTQGTTLLPAQHLPETLMRIRGEWTAAMDGALADGSGARVTCGMILVPEGTGTTVLWSPSTDGDAPWIWWDVMHLDYEEYVADVIESTMTASGRRVIDSKAMRRVRNEELQFVVENTDPGALTGSSVNVLVAGRVLSGS